MPWKPRPSAGKASTASSGGPAKAWKDGDVRFTHPDRIYWVDVGVTKEELADYYLGVWDCMAPHIVNRALALVRCPEGTKGECFFQKHIAANVKHSPLRHPVAGKDHDMRVQAPGGIEHRGESCGAVPAMQSRRILMIHMQIRAMDDDNVAAGQAWVTGHTREYPRICRG